eukprot:gene12735-16974_t
MTSEFLNEPPESNRLNDRPGQGANGGQPAPGRRTMLTRRWSAVAAGALGLMLVGMLSATGVSSNAPVAQAAHSAHAAVSHFSLGMAAPDPVRIRLADDLPAGPATAPAQTLQGPPERRLIGIYQLIAQHRLDEALVATEALTRTAPHFKLAQLVYADLLSARFAPLAGFGAGASASAASAPPELAL